ncbi:uncharacterized protein K02A2.6-like [Ornithodoros turicata]|uniref:uncharacterized protein K02A2.6-like n=1 Tax=Ornithodoros turicata TaxID=34597 RepID=UPI0031390949
MFDPSKEEWNMFQVRFLAAIRVGRVTADADKRDLLISSLSPEVFKRLYNLLQPKDVMEVSSSDIMAKLSEHYTPKRFKEFERFKLFSSRQEENESVKDFVERHSAIVGRCEYEGERDTRACSLLTAFIVGLRDPRVRARLVLEKVLTLESAIRLAESSLAAEAESRQLHSEVPVHKIAGPETVRRRCFRCGNTNHEPDACRFKNEECHSCGKAGHIAKMCQNGRASMSTGKHKPKHSSRVKLVTDVLLADEQDGRYLTCNLLGKDITLQVNTGSRATLLDDRTFIKLGKPKLESSPYRLRALFRPGLGRCTKLQVHLHVREGAQPKFFKPRPIPFATRQAVETDLQRQVKNGVLQPVEVSDWATPIVVVPKPNGAVRVCGDFSVTVNPQLAIAQYPIPRPEELLAVLNGGEKFTKLDLSQAYLQMELDEEAKKMLVINTHKGLFQFNRMPFGIASAPAVFQRTMEQVISGLPSVACYLDDIIVTGRNDEEHLSNLSKVLARLQEFGFTLKREKCAFLQTQVEYLGHIVDADGFRPSPKKVSAILNMPPPNQVSELRSFLGMVQHYGKYLEGHADVCSPLNDLLKKGASWCWTSACVEAFESIKSMLASAKVLTHYDPTKEIFLAVDASSKGLGAVIYHRLHGVDRPIAHASKTLTVAETKYAQIEREALAIIFSVRKFHQYLWGRKFVLYTDHKPLTVIFGPSRGIPVTTASRLQRWALILMSYSFDIQFKGSSKIANADGLSRLPEGPDHEFDKAAEEGVFSVGTDEIFAVQDYHMSTLPVTAKDIAAATLEEPMLTKVAKYVSRGWPGHVAPDLSPFYQRQTELTMHKGCILWGMRTVGPTKLRHKLLDILHDCHIGQSKMKMLARSYIWWPGLDKDIESRVRNCEQCSAVAAQEIPVPLHQWEQPDKAWHRLHADFAELHGKHYLIVIDAFSKWPDIIQMTDNGPPFTSQVFEDFFKQRGIHHVLTPPYHPQSNGLAENFVRTFKTALRRFEEGGDTDKLRDFLFKYRVTPHVTTGRPPCELLNNRHYRSLLDLVRPSEVTCSGRDSLARERQKRNYDRRTQDRQFSVDQGVWMLDNSKKGHWKTGTIVSKQGSVIFTVRDASGKVHRVHKDHLKRRETVESWRCSKNIPASDVRCRPAAIDDPNEEFPLPFPEVEGTSSETFSQLSHSDRPHILSTEADHNVSRASTERPSAVTGSRRYPLRSRREPDRYGVA